MSDPTTAPDHSRRGGMRRPPKGGVLATCRLGAPDPGEDMALRVLDLSETGLRLVVRRPLEPGQLVSVGLGRRGGGRPAPRVGAVVWCLPSADGAHCVGVRFQRRLPIKDFFQLTREAAARAPGETPLPRPASDLAVRPGGGAGEKRRSARHAPRAMRRCRVSPGGGRPDLDATLLDLSQTGAGLLASGPLGAGDTIVLCLEAVAARVPPLDLPARVIYAVELNVGWFLVGAEFARPLPGNQLLRLVSRMGRLAPGELRELTQGPPARA